MVLGERLAFESVQKRHEGWYRLCVTSAGIDVETEQHCRAMSEPFHLTVKECLYPIIVNKYNWQLLCDNVALRRLFPDRTVMAFQWFKNNEAIPGATIDDYAERNELCGVFQLRVTLDHEEVIWSNIIEIVDSIEEIPIRVRIYNSRGEEVDENQVTHGFYLYRYEQGEHCWTQKRLIP